MLNQRSFSRIGHMHFFMVFPLPSLTQIHMELMDKEISETEINLVIKNLHWSKVLGLDGFSGIYYRMYHEILTPHLCSFSGN